MALDWQTHNVVLQARVDRRFSNATRALHNWNLVVPAASGGAVARDLGGPRLKLLLGKLALGLAVNGLTRRRRIGLVVGLAGEAGDLSRELRVVGGEPRPRAGKGSWAEAQDGVGGFEHGGGGGGAPEAGLANTRRSGRERKWRWP
jgi:hypothetical protein